MNLQTKLLFYELSSDKDQKITWPQPAFIIDLTNDEFLVSSITSSDAYHANKKDVSSIFKVRFVFSFLQDFILIKKQKKIFLDKYIKIIVTKTISTYINFN